MAASTAKSTRVLVDVHSGAVWASTSPVSVDGESWTRLMWQVQEQGIRWQTTVSNGGRAIEEAVSTVTPKLPHQRDVWHVLPLLCIVPRRRNQKHQKKKGRGMRPNLQALCLQHVSLLACLLYSLLPLPLQTRPDLFGSLKRYYPNQNTTSSFVTIASQKKHVIP